MKDAVRMEIEPRKTGQAGRNIGNMEGERGIEELWRDEKERRKERDKGKGTWEVKEEN